MKNSYILLLILLSIASPLSALDDDNDSFWQEAANLADASTNWYPQKMSMINREIDPKGQPAKTDEIDIDIILSTNGKQESKITRYIQNGKDITETKQKEALKKSPNSNNQQFSMNAFDGNLFARSEMSNLSYSFLTNIMENNTNYKIYSFQKKIQKNQSIKGVVWFNIKKKVPVKSIYVLDPLPQMMTSFTNICIYQNQTQDLLLMDQIQIEAAGSFLFQKIHFISLIQFAQYEKKQ